MKTQKRDSKGRFTSARAEARKQLIDRAQFLAFHDAVKAMEGETITQILGKKQAEVERNTKHAQTNAEKYADRDMIDVINTIEIKCISACPTVRDISLWLNQPAEQDWPEWVKVGAWIAWDFKDEKTRFKKIDRIENGLLYSGIGSIKRKGLYYYKPARVRPFTAKEAVDLIGRTVVVNGKKVVVNSVYADKCDVWINYASGKINAQYSADNCILEDGQPCGVLEVVK